MLVWIRIPCLPIEYYRQEFMMKIGEQIGRPIKIDHATSFANRGMFARMCVEVDITKPFVSKFKLKRRVRRIEYEGVHLVCFCCGIYGYNKDSCSSNPDKKVSEPVVRGEEAIGGDGKGVHMEVGEDSRVRNEGEKGVSGVEVNPEILEQYGPWMLVTKKNRRMDRRRDPRNARGGEKEGESSKEGQKGTTVKDKGTQPRLATKTEAQAILEALGIVRPEVLRLEQIEEELSSEEGGVMNQLPVARLKGRGKRPDVQISEKEVRNMEAMGTNNKAMQHTARGNKGQGNGSNLSRPSKEGAGVITRTSKQAAAALEHVVVRGANNGKEMYKGVVRHKGPKLNIDSLMREDLGEHHCDSLLEGVGVRFGYKKMVAIMGMRLHSLKL